MKIKRNDKVLVISGKDRGRQGKVLRVLPKLNKVVVEGINLVKKHQRPRHQGEKGQIIEIPAPLDASNLKLVCPKCSRPARFGSRLIEGKKYRVCKKCQAEI